ncbi:uncharacterized protein N7473_011367 [Penicillium subrubescens]|uniref:Uncharacterized protein n=1 Tax=Penicillium subrubescens TaxID=1316194 RepID=A0A1Q5UNC2_9EURO|nr:uncharacterized protein N7473_011367 [Penicillium subrubescens]KAJ5880314.1 hypothetical protein N7473_011367 [Penicillium subrubescens]OKP13978.1 hypothetical protein PENSUB_247 [Penicillium subrubescens]
MVDTRSHSFEDTSSSSNHYMPLTSSSRSESDQNVGSLRITEFATINLRLTDSPASSQNSLVLRPIPKAVNIVPHLQENRDAASPTPSSPKRGRRFSRGSPNGNSSQATFHGPASPDRFIPKREFGLHSATSYRVNKHHYQLSPQERITRRRLPGEDPFLPAAHQSSTFARQRPTPTRPLQRPHRPHLVADWAALADAAPNEFHRRISAGAVWNVGGTAAVLGQPPETVSNDPRSVSGRDAGSTAFVARFLPKISRHDDLNKHESRLALALDIDPTTRLLGTCIARQEKSPSPASPDYERYSPYVWKDSAWKKVERGHWPTKLAKRGVVPSKPFRILDAPFLRDDFYCSTLAYSYTAGVLAVGLGQYVYLWSEGSSLDHPPFGDAHPSNYVTSLSFSSEEGGKSILAVGRQSGQISLWGAFEPKVRFEVSHPRSISCISFKPNTTRRLSERYTNLVVNAEDLAVGDELGSFWYYSVEWPEINSKWSWTGSMTLLAKISAHSQQICGIAWSPDQRFLATGGNDNVCLLFELRKIIPPSLSDGPVSPESTASSGGISGPAVPSLNLGTMPRHSLSGQRIVSHILPSWFHPPPIRPSMAAPLLSQAGTLISGRGKTVLIPSGCQKYRLLHSAAVKAIAFAPWQPSLLATGGGSNDRAIRFWHTRTGVCLATINVFAQVTSLIWSQTRREIVATFGYAQPDHPIRIAVFAWPSCAQVAVIPWGPYGTSWDGPDPEPRYDCGRALWAIGYPGRAPRPPSMTPDNSDILASPASRSPTPSPTRSQSTEHGSSSTTRRKRKSRAVQPKEKEGGMWCTRTIEEGCIIVASSDQTVKFHEVWTGRRTSTGSAACGLFGGSDILEGMEGIEKSGSEVIR